jgi:hypothetical protein
MAEMVDRVTQAIYDAPNGIDGDQLADMLLDNDRITGADAATCRAQVRAVCENAARAAIAALREPTESMCRAATRNRNLADAIWRAMIDAALAEEGTPDG